MTTISAYVVEGKDKPFKLRTFELDEPGPGEVLVRVIASGVCHTDMNTQAGNMPMPLPAILGHEGSGIVEKIGEGVTNVQPGSRVVMGWAFCGECKNCLRGEPRYCLNTIAEQFTGVRAHGPYAGHSAYHRENGDEVRGHFFGQSSFATFSIVRATALVEVDDDVPLELLGPLSCGITTGAGAVFNSAQPEPGESIVVFGVGAVGLGAIMAAKNTPATTIIAVDLHDSRLELSKELGATHIINSGKEDALSAIQEICGGNADYVIDCTGNISVLESAAEAVGQLGTVILVGGAPTDARFSLDHMHTLHRKRVIGTLGGSKTSTQMIPALISLFKQGRFPIDRLVRYYDFDQIDQAIADSHAGTTIKPVLKMPR